MPPTGSSSAPNGDLRRAPASSRRSGANRRGGCASTRCSGPSTNASTHVRGPSGLTGCAIVSRPRCNGLVSSSRSGRCSSNTCNGSRRSSGRRRGAISRVYRLFGDLPFIVSLDSADVWARQTQFDLGAQVGVPPDAFSETGQQWGLPVYRWDVHERDDDRWLRERARRCAELYDGCRINHLVGFYRTYAIPRDGEPYLRSRQPRAPIAQGERLMKIFRSSARRVIAEISAPCPTTCGGRSPGSACRASRCCGGNGTGTRPASRSATPRPTPRPRSR